MSSLVAVEHPDVPAHAEWSSRSKVWVLTIICPYCDCVHIHGGGDGSEPDYGYRASHCLTADNPDYRLIPGPSDMLKPIPQGRRVPGPGWQHLPVGARVRPRRGFKRGTVERVVESRAADGMTFTVIVRWDSSQHAEHRATDCLVRVPDLIPVPAEGDVDG